MPNDPSPSSWLDEVASKAQAEMDRLSATRDRKAAELAEVDADIRQVRSVMRAMGLIESEKRKPAARNTNAAVSDTNTAIVLDYLLTLPEDFPWAILDVHEDLGEARTWTTDATTRAAVERLRRDDIVRKAGREPDGKRRALYKVRSMTRGVTYITQLRERDPAVKAAIDG